MLASSAQIYPLRGAVIFFSAFSDIEGGTTTGGRHLVLSRIYLLSGSDGRTVPPSSNFAFPSIVTCPS